jgi:hypothetical protein
MTMKVPESKECWWKVENDLSHTHVAKGVGAVGVKKAALPAGKAA